MAEFVELLQNLTVKHMLARKGSQVWQISAEQSVFEALQLLAEKNIGALVVVDSDNRAVGIISERDYARRVILQGRSSMETPVRDVMTERVYAIGPENTVGECMQLMTDRHIRHLPVIDGEKLAGVISIGDVVKTIISEQKFIIEQLGNYIVGDRS